MKRVVAKESQIVGTYDDETLLALLNGGTLKLADQYWDAKTSTWRPLTDFIGYRAPTRRRLAPALLRFTMLLTVAGYGALVMWWSLRGSAQPTTSAQPAPETTVAQPLNPPVPPIVPSLVPPTTPPAATKPAEEPASVQDSSAILALLNVEVFDEEVAVTVQNNHPSPVSGFDLKLKYFVLPGDQLVFDSNEKRIAQYETEELERSAKTEALDAMIGSLRRHLKLVSTDVIIWTPSHVRALPTAEQWMAFDDAALGEAGADLAETAAAFAAGASGTDPIARENALTGLLLDLARRSEDMKPLLERSIQRATTARNTLMAELSVAEDGLARLKRQQDDLRPHLADLMAESLMTPVRVEIVHVDAKIEPGLVRRIAVKRQKNERHGMVVELAGADDKAMALSIRR